jgi:hypothetical protein
MPAMRKFLAAAAVSATLAVAIPANAAVLVCSNSPRIDLTIDHCKAAGNDHLANVEAAIAAATGVDVSLLNLVLYGKSDDNPGLFTFSPSANPDDGKITNWTVRDGTLVNYVTVKAAGQFKVYQTAWSWRRFWDRVFERGTC